MRLPWCYGYKNQAWSEYAKTKTKITSGPCDAVDAVVGDIDVKLVCPASDCHVLVATSGAVASEVHDVVATLAVAVLVEEHPRTVTIYRMI